MRTIIPTTLFPRLYLGTMTFQWSQQTSSPIDDAIAQEMVTKFASFMTSNGGISSSSSDSNSPLPIVPVVRIDTARIYAGGKTEPCVGQAIAAAAATTAAAGVDSSFHYAVGTKAHPSQPGGLSPLGIQRQIDASKAAIPSIECFEEYYLHQPDPDHPLLDSLQCLQEYYQQGSIQAIGMSNYHAIEMERAFLLCQEHNITPPTVYQGLYNPLNRHVEEELLPLLRKYNCSFVAYNPLAAGLLTGKYHNKAETTATTATVPQGRFRDNPNYLPRFYTDANFAAVDVIRQACFEADNMSMIDATYRWLLCHSALGSNDGILIGASSLSQLDQNLNAACRRGCCDPLPPNVVAAFDTAWEITRKAGVFPYWRSYSSDMPNREQLDPGASYDPTKTTTTSTKQG